MCDLSISHAHSELNCSVGSLERRDSLNFVIQSVMHDISEGDLGFLCWVFKESEGVLHPCVIESIREVVPRVSTSCLFSVLSSEHSHLCLDHQILKLHGLNQVSVPYGATVRNSDISDAL